jgi:hypothetical protein
LQTPPLQPRENGVGKTDALQNANRFCVALGVALAILAGYNLAIARLAHTSQRQRALAAVEQVSPATECVFLGNSLVEAGCDVEAFAAAWPRAEHAPATVNLALGATTPVEHYLILRRAFERGLRPKLLVYGFFDDQLNASVAGDWSDLVGNRAFSYYFPERAAELYAPGSTLKRWELEFTDRVPMLAERSSLWTQVELLRRRFDEVGMPKKKTNRFGRVDDFGALEAKDVESFNRRCAAVIDRDVGFSKPVGEIVRLAREHGTRVVLVEMPMPTRHRAAFYSTPAWARMRAYLQNLASANEATYIAASDWVRDDAKFEDATHLNEAGAKFFSGELAKTIAQLDPALTPMQVASRP